MNYYDPIIYIVPPEDNGWKLKSVLQKRMLISRSLLSRLKLTDQGIMVNGERKYISVRVCSGDRIEIRMEQESSEDILPQQLPIDVIAEDEHLLIVNKADGMIVHPTHGHYINTLANAVVYYWQQQGLSYRFRPIHRLDRETSGVLAIAKNPYVHHLISEQMQQQLVDKEYIAIVHGLLEDDIGTIDEPIDRNPDSPHERIVMTSGYPAVTHYQVVQRFERAQATMVRLKLETGKTHQIRVHMKYLGHPLIGDKMYGLQTDIDRRVSRHALHAVKLGFFHPALQKKVEYEARMPEDMAQLVQSLN